jgi:DNA-binding CsgD family transcriptional regulator
VSDPEQTHIHRIFGKVGARSRVQVAARARALGPAARLR